MKQVFAVEVESTHLDNTYQVEKIFVSNSAAATYAAKRRAELENSSDEDDADRQVLVVVYEVEV